jgi:hypothetical protein
LVVSSFVIPSPGSNGEDAYDYKTNFKSKKGVTEIARELKKSYIKDKKLERVTAFRLSNTHKP